MEEGYVDVGSVVSLQTVPKAAYCSDFCGFHPGTSRTTVRCL